jgi:hypothetical protein
LLNNNFSLIASDEWKDKTVYRIEGPEENGLLHSIVITVEEGITAPLNQFAELSIIGVKNELQGYEELKRGAVRFQSGIAGEEVVYRWTPVDKREVYQRTVYLVHQQKGYIMMATFTPKTWKTMGPVVDKILMSFRVG